MKVILKAMSKHDCTVDTDYYLLPCIKFNKARPYLRTPHAIWIELIFIRYRLSITIYYS